MRRRRKRRPAGTTLAAKESWPMRGRSSLLVTDFLPNQDLVREVISCNLAGGSRSCCRVESSTIPRKVRLVAGPSPCQPACPAPGRHAAWWTWSPSRWAVQVDPAGGSRPGSAGGCGFIVVLQDPMEGAGKVV